MKFAVAALIAAVSADDTTKVWELGSVQDHRFDASQQITFGDASTASANSRPPYRSNAQLDSSDSESSDDEAVQVAGDYYTPAESGKAFNGDYERTIPARFSADTDDLFMRSMVTTYALEGKTCDDKGKNCAPNGSFWMSEATARAAAVEVLGTHKGLTGDAASKYMDTFFTKSWGHFDVNKTGYVEVIKMPQMMRFLCSDQWMQLGESA